jgi:hypothetical protein
MIPKLQSCAALINAGVKKVWIGNNLSGLLSTGSNRITDGTWIVNDNKKDIKKMPILTGIAEAV